jgi:hypothetical protein
MWLQKCDYQSSGGKRDEGPTHTHTHTRAHTPRNKSEGCYREERNADTSRIDAAYSTMASSATPVASSSR